MKHMLKKLLALILTCLMLTALAVPAAADVIYEPEDSFYRTHASDCVYHRYRRYLTNSETGYVYLYRNPTSGLTVRSYPNGETVSISYLYTSPTGEVWGIVSDDSGWLNMSDLSLIYDSEAFLEEHKEQCLPYQENSFGTIEASSDNPVIVWSYPGGHPTNSPLTSGSITDYVQLTYTDAAGKVWGHISYRYGQRDFWVCLSDPQSETVGKNNAVNDHEIILKHAPVEEKDVPVNSSNMTAIIWAGVLIVMVVIGTALLMYGMFAKKEKK